MWRILTPLSERITLLHAKTMLLIDDEEIKARELNTFRDQGVGTDDEIDAAIAEARSTPERCRDRFAAGFRDRRRKFTALELHRIVFGLLDVASADGDVSPPELERLRELAALLEISHDACDLVASQYQRENRHDA